MEGKVKITNVQAMEVLKAQMNEDQIKKLANAINKNAVDDGFTRNNARRVLAHAILDSYQFMRDDATKSMLKQLMKKYMNGASLQLGEDVACYDFMGYIVETAFPINQSVGKESDSVIDGRD